MLFAKNAILGTREKDNFLSDCKIIVEILFMFMIIPPPPRQVICYFSNNMFQILHEMKLIKIKILKTLMMPVIICQEILQNNLECI